MFLNISTAVAIAFSASTAAAVGPNALDVPAMERRAPVVLEIPAGGNAASTLPLRVARSGDRAPAEQRSTDSDADSAARAHAFARCAKAKARHDHAAERGAAPAWITPCAQADAGVYRVPPSRPLLHNHRKFHEQQ